MVFTDPIPEESVLKSIYGKDYFQGEVYEDYQKEVENRSQDYLKWLEWIQKSTGLSTGLWLDIGCATGGFMHIADEQGWHVCGIDLSEFCVNTAKAAGLKAQQGTALDIPPDWGPFDVISMWDTIEHLDDPISALRAAVQRLRPQGWMVLSTGDISSLAARVMGKRWWLMLPPIHLYYFSRDTIRLMLQEVGLTPVAGKRFGRRLRIGRAFRLLSGASSVATERGPSLYFNALDIMTILAHKNGTGKVTS